MRRTRLAVVAVAGLTIAVAGCGSTGGSGGANVPGTIKATLTDFKIELSGTTAPAGTVTFNADDKGPSIHELVVFKTDLAPNALPTDGNGNVDESKLTKVGELPNIGLSDSPTLKVDLAVGKYVVLCNLPAHYKAGMYAALTVT